jgi:hypothetical protein
MSVLEMLLLENLGAPIGAQAAHDYEVDMEQRYSTLD